MRETFPFQRTLRNTIPSDVCKDSWRVVGGVWWVVRGGWRATHHAPLLNADTNSRSASACAASCCDVAASSSADLAFSRAVASTSITARDTSPNPVDCSADALTVRSTICDVWRMEG